MTYHLCTFMFLYIYIFETICFDTRNCAVHYKLTGGSCSSVGGCCFRLSLLQQWRFWHRKAVMVIFWYMINKLEWLPQLGFYLTITMQDALLTKMQHLQQRQRIGNIWFCWRGVKFFFVVLYFLKDKTVLLQVRKGIHLIATKVS